MAFEWRDYLGTALTLAAVNSESCHRAAVSRAYYAAYGCACDLAEKEGVPRPKKHHVAWQHFTDLHDMRRAKIGADGLRLKIRREAADYDKVPAVSKADAEDACKIAQALIGRVDVLLKRYP